jgi:glycosyltransferase involved in cell wall biosynthesis
MKLNILHITPNFNYACGRSYYAFLLLKYLHQRNHNVWLLTNKGDSFDRLEDYDIPYKIKNYIHTKGPLSFTKSLNFIKTLIKEQDTDIIHTYHRYSELLANQAVKLCRRKKVKTVFTSLSIVNRKYNVEFKSDKIIAVSHTVKNMLIWKFGVKEDKIIHIPNLTDTDELNELETLPEGARDDSSFFNVLSIGRFHTDKNFEILLKALNLLNDKTIKLILIGEGDRLENYKSFIKKNKLNAEIVRPQKNLANYFFSADVCVLPSIHDPFPSFMLQSGLHKKPFIGANVDGIAELIRNNYNGLLFDNKSPLELAYKIYQIKKDRLLAMKCASNLHNRVINRYTQEFIIPKIEKVYRELVKSQI